MRLACDTGGTFTDLIVEMDEGGVTMFKSPTTPDDPRSEEHTSELQSRSDLVCRLLLEKKKPLHPTR